MPNFRGRAIRSGSAALSLPPDLKPAARGTGELRGLLRVGTPINFALGEIIPRLPTFIKLHPALKIKLRATDRPDIVTEGLDISFQFGACPTRPR